MNSENKNAHDRGYKKEANDSHGTPSTEDKTQPLPPPCCTTPDLEETLCPPPEKMWGCIESLPDAIHCPFPSTATCSPALAGNRTILHRRKYETEKYASLLYENNIIIGKSHLQGWEYLVSVSKLQQEPEKYLYDFYDRNIVQTIQRSLLFWQRTIDLLK